jgi:hypothetical protein
MVLVLNRYQQEFGLTPASRSRISLSPEVGMFGAVPPSIAEWDERLRKEDERRKELDAMIWSGGKNTEAGDSKDVSSM